MGSELREVLKGFWEGGKVGLLTVLVIWVIVACCAIVTLPGHLRRIAEIAEAVRIYLVQ